MAKFSNDEDVQTTKDAGQRSGGGDFLKLEEGNNYLVILSDEYEQGYSHWVKTSAKTFKRTCLADIEDKGWDPEGCPLCALALDMYDMKKAAKLEGDEKTSKEYNERGNNLRSGYAALMQAVKGKAVVERRLNKKTGKKVKKVVPDFEEVEVGSLRLTHSQITKMFALIDDENYPFIKSAEDLVGRILNFIKEKTSPDKKYAEVTKVIPAKKPFDIESLEIDEEDIPVITEEFALDDDLEEVVELYSQELEEDEEEEYEEESIKKKKSSKKKSSKKAPAKKKKKKPVEEEEEEEDEESDEESDDDDDWDF